MQNDDDTKRPKAEAPSHLNSESKSIRLSFKQRLLLIISGLFFAFIVLLACELATSMLLSKTDLDRILDVIEQDSILFWRNRDSLETVFTDVAVRTNDLGFRIGERAPAEIGQKRDGAFRIFCLGGSPTFGWGVDYESTYPRLLEKSLRDRTRRDVEVFNAGMIGFSSHQGRLLLEREIAARKPDLITVAYVINDVDRYRFYRSNGRPDRELEPRGDFITAVNNLIGRSRFAALYGRILGLLMHGSQSFEGRLLAVYRPGSVRVPPSDYRDNLRWIIDFARREGIIVVMLKMPVNLPVIDPAPVPIRNRARETLDRGVKHYEAKDYASAATEFALAASLDPYLSEASYRLGVVSMNLKESERAGEAFAAMMKSEAYRCGRDGLRYNEIMQALAEENDLPIVDVPAEFKTFADRSLFLDAKGDPIHPNEAGHKIIGELLFAAIEGMPL